MTIVFVCHPSNVLKKTRGSLSHPFYNSDLYHICSPIYNLNPNHHLQLSPYRRSLHRSPSPAPQHRQAQPLHV
ncbi:hypothetical protein QVD17_06334 [Tagetes erecta]|uniref:Uncharacterized protein n=1 Tax=Tagetes erecta TaxID=13708 RepID=A0AAD8PC62_TARER|nr:hypothetical protein QVD17_06334 [Tagetes erecta]